MTLTEQALRDALTPKARAFYHITIEEEVASTNTVLKQLAAAHPAEAVPTGTVLIARRQSGGRGRHGRAFYSPEGTGLYMSILVHPTLSARDTLSLTTDTAVVCAEAIDAVRGQGAPAAKIKWVNDIYLPDAVGDAKKVCGILCEAALSPDAQQLAYAVIGIGINLVAPPGGFPEELTSIAGMLFSDAGAACDPNRLAAEILNRLLPVLHDPLDPTLSLAYRSRSMLDGQRILVRPASSVVGAEYPATAMYVEEDFGLRVRYDDGREAVLYSGEVEKIRLT